jgi:hypothetical protein
MPTTSLIPSPMIGAGDVSNTEHAFLNSLSSNVQTQIAAAGGAWTLIGTSVASSSATLDITGLDSTYDAYAIAWSDVVPASDGVHGYLRVGDSGGIDSGTDYAHHCQSSLTSSNAYTSNPSAADNKLAFIGITTGSAAGEGMGGMLYLMRPGDGSTRPTVHGTHYYINSSGIPGGGIITGSRLSVITLDRVQILFASGNVATGRLTVWGIAHA